jgi:hypothetical protein
MSSELRVEALVSFRQREVAFCAKYYLTILLIGLLLSTRAHTSNHEGEPKTLFYASFESNTKTFNEMK